MTTDITSTESYNVFYESEPRIYGICASETPLQTHIGGLQVSEIYVPDLHAHIKPGLGEYKVRIEAVVEDRNQFWRFQEEAFSLAEKLDRLWVYVVGMPISKAYKGKHISAHEYISPPPGWLSNLSEVNDEIKSRMDRTIDVIGSSNVIWLRLLFMPLRRAIKAYYTYLASDQVLLNLIEFHYQSHVIGALEAKLFLLAKALEIVRELLPGENLDTKLSSLGCEVTDSLCSSLGLLFDLSNNRLEIRHAVASKTPSLTLHPNLSSGEQEAFLKDADIIIRSLVCQRFDIPVLLVKKDDPRKASCPKN